MVSQVRDRCNTCAGGCREPRCIRSPGRGSQRLHRALGGTRILLAAAPTAPPCFCRWQRSSLLHRGFFTRRTVRRVDAVRIHPCIPFFKADKTETPVPIGYRSSWWARVDVASRAMSLALLQNKNLSALAYVEAFWWARVDVASRAAKNSPLGCFYAVFCDSAAAVRIHPRGCDLRCRAKQKTSVISTLVLLVERSNPNPNHCPLGHLWRQFHRK